MKYDELINKVPNTLLEMISVEGFEKVEVPLYPLFSDMVEDMIGIGWSLIEFMDDKELQHDLVNITCYEDFENIYYKYYGNEDIKLKNTGIVLEEKKWEKAKTKSLQNKM